MKDNQKNQNGRWLAHASRLDQNIPPKMRVGSGASLTSRSQMSQYTGKLCQVQGRLDAIRSLVMEVEGIFSGQFKHSGF